MLSHKLQSIYHKFVDIIFSIILVFIILGIAVGTFMLFDDVWKLMKLKGITGHYIDLIADVLTLYVLVELSRSLVEYFHVHRLRLTFIIDAAIIFIIREILIGLFKHNIEASMLYALTAFLFVLGAIRTATVIVYQREKNISDESTTDNA